MSTFTELDIPVPQDTDPLAAVYQYIRDLAAHLDEKVIFGAQEGPVNNDTTLVQSSQFTFTAKAGKQYAFEMHLIFSTTVPGMDVRLAMHRNHACDLNWSAIGTKEGDGALGEIDTNAVWHGDSADDMKRGLGDGRTGIHIHGTVDADSGVDADIALSWAQGTAMAANLYILSGSYMKVRVIP